MNNMSKFVELLNRYGIYTRKQYLERVEMIGALNSYARNLELAIDGMSDPTKPILVYGENISISDVSLRQHQQIIVAPSARYVSISHVQCRQTKEQK